MKYRLPGAKFIIPRRKEELIDLIAPSWNGTKQSLRDMERSQLVEILKRMKQEKIIEIMKKKG